MSISFYKLKDDTWGVRIKEFAGVPNTEVEVTTKAGETRTVTLGKRVAKFDDAELWSLVNTKKPVQPEEEPF